MFFLTSWGLPQLIGDALSNTFSDPLVLGIVAVVFVVSLLMFMNSPPPFTIMIAFLTFATLSGLAGSLPVSNLFLPFMALITIIGMIALAFAIWKSFGSQ